MDNINLNFQEMQGRSKIPDVMSSSDYSSSTLAYIHSMPFCRVKEASESGLKHQYTMYIVIDRANKVKVRHIF